MKICDAHVHLGESGPWQPYMKPAIFIEELIGLFERFSVERAVVFPNPNVGDKYPETNDYIAGCVEKYPKRLVGFGRVDPRRMDAINELERMKMSWSYPDSSCIPWWSASDPTTRSSMTSSRK